MKYNKLFLVLIYVATVSVASESDSSDSDNSYDEFLDCTFINSSGKGPDVPSSSEGGFSGVGKNKFSAEYLYNHGVGLCGFMGRVADVLSYNKDVNQRDDEGKTSLHLHRLIENGNKKKKLLKYLLQQGADQSICDNNGETLLGAAKRLECEKYIKLLGKYSE